MNTETHRTYHCEDVLPEKIEFENPPLVFRDFVLRFLGHLLKGTTDGTLSHLHLTQIKFSGITRLPKGLFQHTYIITTPEKDESLHLVCKENPVGQDIYQYICIPFVLDAFFQQYKQEMTWGAL